MTTATQTLQVGTELPALTIDPISRTTLALFAGASGDHNPTTSTSTLPAPPDSTMYSLTGCCRWPTWAGP